MKPRHKSPNQLAIFLLTAFVALAGTSFAQLQVFKTSNLSMQIFTMSTANGDASIHNLNVNVATNGVISGNGKRFDSAAASFNANPLSGTVVSINPTASRVGLPVVPHTNVNVYYDNYSKRNLTNWTYTTNAPATILLNDGTRFKGVITKSRDAYQYWDGTKVVTQTNNQIYTGLNGVGIRNGRFGTAYGQQ